MESRHVGYQAKSLKKYFTTGEQGYRYGRRGKNLTFEDDFPGRFGARHEGPVGCDSPLGQVPLQVRPGPLNLLENGGQDDAPVGELAELEGLAVGAVEAQVVAGERTERGLRSTIRWVNFGCELSKEKVDRAEAKDRQEFSWQ